MTITTFTEKYHNNCHDYLSNYYIERYALKEYIPLLYSIEKNIKLLTICDFIEDKNMYREMIVCDQHAVIFTHNEDINPIISTYALNACIGLLIYEPKLKIASLSHIDGLPGYSNKSALRNNINITYSPVKKNIDSIITLLMYMKDPVEKYDFEYYLIGGIFGMSEIMIHDIIENINQRNNNKYSFVFKGRNLLGPINQSRNICFDTRTNKFYNFKSLDNAQEYLNNINVKTRLPSNIIFGNKLKETSLDVTYYVRNIKY